MRKAIIIVSLALTLAGCGAAANVQIAKPCGVIVDPLKDVRATTRDGERRLSNHFERGVAAKCWGR
jgi:hypothetical protein